MILGQERRGRDKSIIKERSDLIIRIRRDSIIYEVKTIRPLSLPVPIPAHARATEPNATENHSSHLPPPAGPTGVHPDAVPLILTIPQEYTQQIQARRGEGGWEQKRTDGFYFVDNRITPDSYNLHL